MYAQVDCHAGKDHWLRESVFSCIRQAASEIRTIRDTSLFADAVSTCPYVTRAGIREINMGTGSVCAEVELDSSLFTASWAKLPDWRSTEKTICCLSCWN